jgi:hypothetical protein
MGSDRCRVGERAPLRSRGNLRVGEVAGQHVAQLHLKGGQRAAGDGPAEQVAVVGVAHRLALVGEHDGDAVADAVEAAQPRVVQDAVLSEVQQRLLVDGAGQQAEQQRVQIHGRDLSVERGGTGL